MTDLQCAVCLDLICLPTICHPCAHRFCRFCLLSIVRFHRSHNNYLYCPLCRCRILSTSADREMNRRVIDEYPTKTRQRIALFRIQKKTFLKNCHLPTVSKYDSTILYARAYFDYFHKFLYLIIASVALFFMLLYVYVNGVEYPDRNDLLSVILWLLSIAIFVILILN